MFGDGELHRTGGSCTGLFAFGHAWGRGCAETETHNRTAHCNVAKVQNLFQYLDAITIWEPRLICLSPSRRSSVGKYLYLEKYSDSYAPIQRSS